jgi:uncharacterized membrane protein YphA (DoxX/SURF4 family)
MTSSVSSELRTRRSRPATAAGAHERLASAVGAVAGVLLGLAFLLAAWTKAVDPVGFAEQMVRDGLMVPGLAPFAAVAVVTIECGLAFALLVNLRRPVVVAGATLVMAGFLGLAAWQWIYPPAEAASCGCFGNLIQQEPGEHLASNAALFTLALLSWLGATRVRGRAWRWSVAVLGAALGLGFTLAAPRLPIDSWPGVTTLAPGVSVEQLGIEEIVPELTDGEPHLVLLIDRTDEATRADVARINERLALVGPPGAVYALAEEDEELAWEFMMTAAPAFDVRGAPWGVLKPMYRELPRAFLVDDGRVVQVWERIPPDPVLDALAEGRTP